MFYNLYTFCITKSSDDYDNSFVKNRLWDPLQFGTQPISQKGDLYTPFYIFLEFV